MKGLKSGAGCIGAILVLVVLIVMSLKGVYNSLVTLDETVNNSWAQVENQLQRRMDLIPNLVNTVKGYAEHEREVLTEVTKARASVANANTPEEAMTANNQLSGALARLMVVVEQYPNLKADQTFLKLQDELAGTENRIAVERRRYNETVREINQKIRSFPTVLFAGLLGFDKRDYFEAPQSAKDAPTVDFTN